MSTRPSLWVKRAVRRLFRRSRLEAELSEEIHLHLDMETEELVRLGWSHEKARKEAHRRLGGVEQTREGVRDVHPLHWLGASGLDVKLGLRMLRKHWALTLFGGAAMATSITIGASVFELLEAVEGKTLPLEEGDRVVVVQMFDRESQQTEGSSLEDFERWETGLHSVGEVGAFRTIGRNLSTASGPMPPVLVAEISATGFGLARVAPLIGRPLLMEDERPNAPPVVVIGSSAWQSTFAGDPDVIGQQVQLDDVFYTIVGVMPEGFAFPISHQYWTPLKSDTSGPVVVFGRLARDADLRSAQAEVEALGLRESQETTGDSGTLQVRVVPYIQGLTGGALRGVLQFAPWVLCLLLIPPCGNVAILIYARTLARQGEFAARTAFGASRGRIIGQIFVEALVLATAAAALALILTPTVVDFLHSKLIVGGTPFWMDFGLSWKTIAYGFFLAVLAALIAGGVPAFRATGRGKLTVLHRLGARSAPMLGRSWTALVLIQVGLAVAIVPTGIEAAWALLSPSLQGPRFAAEEYLTARLSLGPRTRADARSFASIRDELVRSLRDEPGVASVTVAEGLPTQETYPEVQIEGPNSIETAAFNRVDLDFFQTFDLRLLAGRAFEPGDLTGSRNAILVSRTFAHHFWRDANPLGRRIRTIAQGVRTIDGRSVPFEEAGPWLEVVGVVDDFSAESPMRVFYRPLPRVPETVPVANGRPLSLAIHADSAVSPDLGQQLREIAASVDPELRIDPLQTMDAVWKSYWLSDAWSAFGLAALLAGLVAFSMAGIYTLLTFAVVGRRREIGIRCALGAPPLRLVTGIFRSVLAPVGVGIAAGGFGALLFEYYLSGLMWEGVRPLPWILPAAEAFLLVVAILASARPALEALRIDPAENLRTD